MATNRRRNAGIASLLLLLLLTGCEQEPGKPNILLVVLDDFGYNDLALNNGSDSPTPTLDDIARQGIRFTRHYTESSCTPSRIALLTGLYPARVGAQPYANGIDEEIVTLPDSLGANGYTTYMIGKWHAGDSHRESRPEFQGFDHWFGFVNQMYLRGPHSGAGYTRGRPTYHDPWLETESADPVQHRGHLTDILTDKAIEVMTNQPDNWFIYLSYYAPHAPIQPAKEYVARFPDNPAGRYQALKLQLDTNLGRIIEYLRQSGKLQNTMIVVVSDNGGTEREWPSNLPFSGQKSTYSEGGLRTPLLLWWPRHWEGGATDDRIAMIFDIYPTILTALGLTTPPQLDGSDLFGPIPDRELRWYSHFVSGDSFGMLSRDGQWRLSNWTGVAELLFREEDFAQANPVNRRDEQAQIAERMLASMRAWIRSITRVDDLNVAANGDTTEYAGAAFRRSPLGGSHSMGFVFRRGEAADGTSEEQLVRQRGYIDIGEAAGSLRIRVDGNELAVDIPAGAQCFSLVVTSQMLKSNMAFYREKEFSHTAVYLNGQQVAAVPYRNPDLASASPRNVLSVLSSAAKRWYMPESAEVFLSTRVIPPGEVQDEVSPGLLAACDPVE